jgi:DNA ligase-1
MTPADIIEQLEATSKRTEKEAIIKAAWDANCLEFFQGAVMAYDSLVTFGVKKLPLIQGEDDADFVPALDWKKFSDIAGKLQRRELTGNMARDVLRAAADSASVRDWNTWYRRILLKDLKCGITETTINKILERAGETASAYIIPVFSCQLAKNGDDHTAKIVGRKMLDPKLDGVRIITILNRELNTVTQYTRDGKQNDRFENITQKLSNLLPLLKQSMVFDGEMISRSFQDLMKQVNRKEDVDTSDARLGLFDVLPLRDFLAGECKMTQSDRHDLLVGFMPFFQQHCGDRVYVIPKMTVDLDTAEGKNQLREFNRETIDAGYEGIMIKDPLATYRTKRTDSWLKIKPWVSVDLEVIAVEPGKPESKFAHTLGGLVCRGVDQERLIEVSVGGGYTEELRDEIWRNRDQMIGRIVEIKGDVLTKAQESEVWSLRFPVFMGFRTDKT